MGRLEKKYLKNVQQWGTRVTKVTGFHWSVGKKLICRNQLPRLIVPELVITPLGMHLVRHG